MEGFCVINIYFSPLLDVGKGANCHSLFASEEFWRGTVSLRHLGAVRASCSSTGEDFSCGDVALGFAGVV